MSLTFMVADTKGYYFAFQWSPLHSLLTFYFEIILQLVLEQLWELGVPTHAQSQTHI